MAVTIVTKDLPTIRLRGQVSHTRYIQLSNGAVTEQSIPSTQSVTVAHVHKRGSRDSEFVTKAKSGQWLPEYDFRYQTSYCESNLVWTGRSVPPSNSYVTYLTITRQSLQPDPVPTGWVEPSWLEYDSPKTRFRLQDKAKGTQFSTPVFFAEAGKTASMVASRASQMVGILRALRRGRFSEAKALLATGSNQPLTTKEAKALNRDFARDPTRTASSTWLEWTYGWTPFMSEVYSAASLLWELQQHEKNLIARVRTSSTSGYTVVTRKDLAGDPLVQSNSAVFVGTITTRATQTERQRWAFKPNAFDLPGKLGLTNPLEVAWELVPFSFVADWFLPIGDYLAQLDVPLRFNHKSRVIGLRRVYTVERKGVPTQPGLYNSVNQGTFSSKYGIVTVKRITGLPLPVVGARELVPKFGIEGFRAISAIALLRQQLQNLRK